MKTYNSNNDSPVKRKIRKIRMIGIGSYERSFPFAYLSCRIFFYLNTLCYSQNLVLDLFGSKPG